MSARDLTRMAVFLVLLAPVLGAGCAAPRGERGWGQDVPLFPGLDRVVRAAAAAAAEPHTWVPAVGAAAVALGGWDRPVSRWAREHTPVFDSRANAEDAGDALLYLVGSGALAAALAAPSGPDLATAVPAKTRALAVEGAAVASQGLAVLGLKAAVGRQRPTGSRRESFPSGHASTAATFAALGRHNVDAAGVRGPAGDALDVGFTGLAVGTAWARIEAGRHYPTDVLVGAALGNFVSSLWYRAYLRSEGPATPLFSLTPAPGGLAVQLGGEF